MNIEWREPAAGRSLLFIRFIIQCGFRTVHAGWFEYYLYITAEFWIIAVIKNLFQTGRQGRTADSGHVNGIVHSRLLCQKANNVLLKLFFINTLRSNHTVVQEILIIYVTANKMVSTKFCSKAVIEFTPQGCLIEALSPDFMIPQERRIMRRTVIGR